jgi:hypothetical protein
LRFLFFSTDDIDVSCAMMRPLRKLLRSKRPGVALPLAMTAVMILLAMGVGLLTLGMNARIFSMRTCSDISARSAADAGLAMAVFEMGEKLKVTPWDDSSLPEATNAALPYCDSVYDYTVTGNSDGSYSIEASGAKGLAARQVACTLKLQGPFEYAIFGTDGVELKSSATVDWYNNDDDDAPMKIGTNSIESGAVKLGSSATINGDVMVGPGGDLDVAISNSGTITGSTGVSTQTHELEAITVPTWLEALPSCGTIQNDTTVTTSARYSSIDLGNSKTLQIDGDVTLYITGGLTLGNSAEIEVQEDASLVLYLGGDFEGKNSSNINNLTEDAKKLQIYGLDGCEDMVFKNSSSLYGVIYAPNADVIMHNSADVYGAVISKSLDYRNSATLHYDASLRDADVDDEAISFVVTDWHEQ